MRSLPGVKYFSYLFLFATLLLASLLVLNKISPSLIPAKTVITLVTGFTLISFASLLIFFSGFNKEAEKSVFLTLISLGVKMLLSFVFALVYIIGFKNREAASVILFFVLYLGFTLFVIFTFVSVLKKKSV